MNALTHSLATMTKKIFKQSPTFTNYALRTDIGGGWINDINARKGKDPSSVIKVFTKNVHVYVYTYVRAVWLSECATP